MTTLLRPRYKLHLALTAILSPLIGQRAIAARPLRA
jgi:hypothetical protein